MSFSALRALALELNLFAHGVDIEVEADSMDAPVETRGIWKTFVTNEAPQGPFARREVRRVMAIEKTATVAVFPKGMRVTAPERDGETATGWLVDAVDEVLVDQVRVVLVPDPDWVAE